MAMSSLKDVYLDQLQDLYSACKQSHSVTGALADAATEAALKEALSDGATGIRDGMGDIAALCEAHGVSPTGEHCKGMEGLVNEARAHGIDQDFDDADARDAMIITQYQRMCHYAIAGYGCLAAFARRLGLAKDEKVLRKCLDATYDGDDRMTAIAVEGGVNAAAAG